MKTPITDESSYPPAIFREHVELVPADIARRLELDRAALMEALAEIHQEAEMGSFAENRAWDALTAARANFPTP